MPDDQITLRTATLADVALLREFEQGVVAAERPLALNMRDGKVEYYDLPALIKSEQVHLLIAEQHAEPAACGYLRIDTSKPHNKSHQHGYIGFIYVNPNHRGLQLAQHIIEALIRWGKQHELSVFTLDVYNGNSAAIHVYQKLGFKPNLIEMVLET
ncbi:GNAT family N-acetyltransferase [Arenicella xantha]|uniref:Ribosomal protein S18 acetylase RimI-like enzyme n=1 Tax=Arenicella xantha TaxID=644221 RepID=A0A395JLU6_9GAMM|nr:GNAT family N-acetyltransferase [Arenicella xantha]RBP51763.1 ribosomal protein S18 acetylase RimI-like enzyme [Arenicella xantha]